MRLALPALLIALVVAAPCFAQEATTSSAEDKAQALALVKQLEDDPLASGAENARQWLTNFIVNAPDLFISTCPELLGPLNGQGKNGAPEHHRAALLRERGVGDPEPRQGDGSRGGLRRRAGEHASPLREPSEEEVAVALAPPDDLRSRAKKGTLADYVRENIGKCQ